MNLQAQEKMKNAISIFILLITCLISLTVLWHIYMDQRETRNNWIRYIDKLSDESSEESKSLSAQNESILRKMDDIEEATSQIKPMDVYDKVDKELIPEIKSMRKEISELRKISK